MELPDFILGLPSADVPFDESVVKTHALTSKDGLLVFFECLKDFEVPPHSHRAQWGTVLEGKLDLTIEGVEKTHGPGESYSIPAGAVHSAKLYAGSKFIDFFEEADRYGIKR